MVANWLAVRSGHGNPPEQETNLADDKSKRGGADRARISVMEDYEVKYLAQKHGATEKRIKELVAELGNSRNKVEAALKREAAAKTAAKAAKKAPAKKTAARKTVKKAPASTTAGHDHGNA